MLRVKVTATESFDFLVRRRPVDFSQLLSLERRTDASTSTTIPTFVFLTPMSKTAFIYGATSSERQDLSAKGTL